MDMAEGHRDVERDLAATAGRPNPFPGSTPVERPGGPTEYHKGPSWRIDPEDPYFHQTPDGSFYVPEDSSYRTGPPETDAKVRITEQRLDPGIVRIEVDLNEEHVLTEVIFTVKNGDRSPEATFYLSGVGNLEDGEPHVWILGRGKDSPIDYAHWSESKEYHRKTKR